MILCISENLLSMDIIYVMVFFYVSQIKGYMLKIYMMNVYMWNFHIQYQLSGNF